jgi:hypothetical protein
VIFVDPAAVRPRRVLDDFEHFAAGVGCETLAFF